MAPALRGLSQARWLPDAEAGPPHLSRLPTHHSFIHPTVSFFERAGNAYFNSLVVADADGSLVGHYRKSHIPDGPGCERRAALRLLCVCAAHSLRCATPAGLLQWRRGGARKDPRRMLMLRMLTPRLLPCRSPISCCPVQADQEKFYFSPGDTGFQVFRTRFADIGARGSVCEKECGARALPLPLPAACRRRAGLRG